MWDIACVSFFSFKILNTRVSKGIYRVQDAFDEWLASQGSRYSLS